MSMTTLVTALDAAGLTWRGYAPPIEPGCDTADGGLGEAGEASRLMAHHGDSA